MTENRRHHERFMIGIPVTVVRSDPAVQLAGQVHDLSAGGVRVECDADAVMQFAVGDRVTVDAAGGTCTGRVIRRGAGEIAIAYDTDDISS